MASDLLPSNTSSVSTGPTLFIPSREANAYAVIGHSDPTAVTYTACTGTVGESASGLYNQAMPRNKREVSRSKGAGARAMFGARMCLVVATQGSNPGTGQMNSRFTNAYGRIASRPTHEDKDEAILFREIMLCKTKYIYVL